MGYTGLSCILTKRSYQRSLHMYILPLCQVMTYCVGAGAVLVVSRPDAYIERRKDAYQVPYPPLAESYRSQKLHGIPQSACMVPEVLKPVALCISGMNRTGVLTCTVFNAGTKAHRLGGYRTRFTTVCGCGCCRHRRTYAATPFCKKAL